MLRSKFVLGLIVGGLLFMLVDFILNSDSTSRPVEQGMAVIASVGEKKLHEMDARHLAKGRLNAVESEEYRVLYDVAEDWIEEQVLQKEAANQGVDVELLKTEEIKAKVHITDDRLRIHYNNRHKQYGREFDRVKNQIEAEVYDIAYEAQKEKLITKLRTKYAAEILLEKPVNYVYTKPTIASKQIAAAPAAPPSNVAPKPDPVSKSREIQKRLKGLPAKGPTNAPVTMVEYADFHCGYCKKAHPSVQKLLTNYSDKIRYVFRHFPLSRTPGEGSFLTHEASMCARAQERFWEYSKELFEFSGTPERADLLRIASDLKLKVPEFKTCLEEGTYRNEIQSDKDSGIQRGVRGTPTFFFNDERVAGALPYEKLRSTVDDILNPNRVPTPPKPKGAKLTPVVFDDLEGKISEGPSDAAVTLVEFSDFHCPFCKRVTPTMEQLMQEYDGKIRRVWRHYPLPMHQGADKTHEASECANEQGKFWEFHNKLFDKVGGYRTPKALIDLADSLGMEKTAFANCLQSGQYTELVQKDLKQGASVGVTGTPAVFVNGYRVSGARPFSHFKSVVDDVLAGKEPSALIATASPKQPRIVKLDDLDGKPTRGNPDAPITIVEFSDFHCPFCKRAQPTLKKVEEEYGDRVRFVWRHFPLPIHPEAPRAHEASQCAFEQGKFWEFHAKIFEDIRARGDDVYMKYAADLGLDTGSFKQCLESEKYAEFIKQELKRGGEVGVRGTPAFFINGNLLSGAQPFNRFKALIDELLEKS